MSLHQALERFDPDSLGRSVVAVEVGVREQEIELPMHRHRKGQLVVALQGGVMCRAQGGLWMVPARRGVWIPGGLLHSNHVTANGRIALLFIDPARASLPATCCSLALSPLVIELIRHLATLPSQTPSADRHTTGLIEVLLEELRRMATDGLHLPIPADRRLKRIVEALIRDPSDRRTIDEWATRLAMSERTLARLALKETGMSFGRWRQQLQLVVALQRLSAGASVQSVSDALGYESVSAFITMFRKALGKPPGRYIAEM